MLGKQVIRLILTDDDVERAHLEQVLDTPREEMIDYYIEMCRRARLPVVSNDRPSTPRERLAAIRAFVSGKKVPNLELVSCVRA
jgi:hypothetical protein